MLINAIIDLNIDPSSSTGEANKVHELGVEILYPEAFVAMLEAWC